MSSSARPLPASTEQVLDPTVDLLIPTSHGGQRRAISMFRKNVGIINSRPDKGLTLLQRKVSNSWIKFAISNPPDEDGFWSLPSSILKEDIDYDSRNSAHLKEAVTALQKIAFLWDVLASENKKIGWESTVLFPKISFINGVVRFTIWPDIYQELKKPEVYALIDMAIVRRFRSAPALGIWEFCVRFERIGKTSQVRWEDFRDMILGEESRGQAYLREYKQFKNRFLGKAIKEINSETDHTIQLLEIKEKRKVTSIQFLVQRKEANDSLEPPPLNMLGKMLSLGISQTEAAQIWNRFGEEIVTSALDYTERRMANTRLKRLELPAAYFKKALQERYAVLENPEPAKQVSSSPAGFDINSAFYNYRTSEARKLYAEMDSKAKRELIEKYNAQVTNPKLSIKSRITKAAEAVFFGWLAKETWGEATSEEMLKFAAQLLSKQAAASPST